MNLDDTLSSSTILSEHLWASSTSTMATTTIDPYLRTDPIGAGDEISRFTRSQLTFAAVMTILIMVAGIFGNLLTIIALVKCPKVRNVAAAFIISLCLADCIFCAFVLPFNAFRFIRGTWTHGDFLCRLIPLMQYGNIGVSLLCIAMITINRYIMIAHHSAYSKIYKNQWIGLMIAFCWLFAYGMQMPTFFKVWGAFDYDSKLGTCSILPDENGRSSKTALFVIAFVIPCLIIIGCYAKIFWVVHKSEIRLRKHAHKQNSIPNNMRQVPSVTNPVASPSRVSVTSSTFGEPTVDAEGKSQKSLRVKDQRDIKSKRNEWRITKMVLAIFLSFMICYLPITVVKVTDKDVRYPGFHVFGYIMLYMSACINPVIYVIMNKQYRQAYKTVLMCKPSRLLPFTQAGGSSAVGGEKWKDIRSSYNNSRTMVSQVSLPDQNQSSFSSTPPQPQVAMQDLTKKPELPQQQITSIPTNDQFMNWLKTTNSSTTGVLTPRMTPTPNNNNNLEFTVVPVNGTANSIITPNKVPHPPVQKEGETQQPSSQRRDMHQRPSGTRIILAEEDVIVEEEEYQDVLLTPPTTTELSPSLKEHYHLNTKGIPDSTKVHTQPIKLDDKLVFNPAPTIV